MVLDEDEHPLILRSINHEQVYFLRL